MQMLTEIVRNIVVIILLITFLQMLLPSQSMQRFIKVAMGLFVLISFLNPFLDLLNAVKQEDFAVMASRQAYAQENSFRQRVEEQIAAMLKIVHGLQDLQVKVQIARNSPNVQRKTIKEVIVLLEQEKKQSGNLSAVERGSAPDQGEIVYTVCRYFGLQENQVRVEFR